MVHIRFRLKEILEERGKTRYWLAKKVTQLRCLEDNCDYGVYRLVCRIYSNESAAARISILEDLCEVLNIHVSELFEQTED